MNSNVKRCMGILAALVLAEAVEAEVRTWDGGAGTTNWSDGNNWNPDGVPVDTDSVTIQTPGVNVFLSGSSAELETVLITNTATLTFTASTNAQLRAKSVYVMQGATLTHSVITPMTTNSMGQWDPDSRVWVVCSNLVVGRGGKINTDARGYKGGYGGTPRTNGAGPGGGTNQWTGGGGGYGGSGGGSAQAGGGGTYGSVTEPDAPGSGSGGRDGVGSGVAGGGWVRLEVADQAAVDGAITANGASGSFAGGGSGGSVFLRCRTVSGGGLILANAGHGDTDGGNHGGGGGGGRIALVYDPVAQSNANQTARPTIQFGANAGWAHNNGYVLAMENAIVSPGVAKFSGELGTIYLSDASFFPSPVMQGGEMIIPGGLTLSVDSLTISNGILSLPSGTTLVVSNDLTIAKNFGGLRMTNGVLDVRGNLTATADHYGFSYLGCASGSAFTVGGNIVIGNRYTFRAYSSISNATIASVGTGIVCTNAGRFFLYAGPTNGVAADEYGMLINVGGDIVISSNAYLCPASHPYNGGSCKFVVTNLTILPGIGGINASALGYEGGGNYGFKTNNGFGPGGGKNGWLGSGGGHGGIGGWSTVAGGGTYGSVVTPRQPGSGAGGRDLSYGNPARVGSTGGGAVWVEASKRITLNGRILADADGTREAYGGGGAGGSIYLVCETLVASNGLITANGARSSADGINPCGGGGGGRVALHYNAESQALVNAVARPTLQIAANHGPAYYNTYSAETLYPGTPGSIYLTDSSFFPGAVLQGGEITIPGASPYTFNSLIVSNSRAIFNGVTLVVSNDLTIGGSFGGVDFSNTAFQVGGSFRATGAIFSYSYLRGTPGGSFSIGSNFVADSKSIVRVYSHPTDPGGMDVGALIATNGGMLHIYAGATNTSGPGMQVRVTGDILTSPGSWIIPYSHSSNGASVCFKAANMVIATNSGFNANETGFDGGLVGLNTGFKGFGPGGGGTVGAAGSGGGGYGGVGSGAAAGGVYGSSNAPTDCGSGGGGYNSGHTGSRGGGCIWLDVANRITLRGQLTANGNRMGTHGGGGSGGGIYIRCKVFQGESTAQLSAKGGAQAAGFPTNPGGGGGGGRIAVWRVSGAMMTTDVSGGGGLAGAGTVVWGDLPLGGTLILIR